MKKDATPVQTIREQITGHLRGDILGGAIPPGSKLREQELAQRFGVSRGPIRDVLLALTQQGLVVSVPNCGARVSAAPGEWMQPLVVKMRREIEVFALQQSIKTIDEEDIARLEKIVENMHEACEERDMKAIAELDISFHQCLLEFVGEAELVAIWLPIVTRMILHYSRLLETEQIYEEHSAIVNALREKDIKKAVKALEQNIQ